MNEQDLVMMDLEGEDVKSSYSAWDRVQIARGSDRAYTQDYINGVFDQFMKLHGDRAYRDDGAIVGGIASINGKYVTVLGQQKGRTLKENEKRNFGMPYPEGYRKALRLMKQAEKFHRPIICFIDTPGAFCGMEAEERGQGEAIARNLYEMAGLTVPILSIVIGEGGSGGALALGVANEVWMLENATYSVLSPEGFASILWKAPDLLRIDGTGCGSHCSNAMGQVHLHSLDMLFQVHTHETAATTAMAVDINKTGRQILATAVNDFSCFGSFSIAVAGNFTVLFQKPAIFQQPVCQHQCCIGKEFCHFTFLLRLSLPGRIRKPACFLRVPESDNFRYSARQRYRSPVLRKGTFFRSVSTAHGYGSCHQIPWSASFLLPHCAEP